MYCKTKYFLILCAIPLIKAADLKIDGLLNLGDSWSYEYRILRNDSSKRPYLREDAQEKSKKVSREKNYEIPHGVIYRKREEEITRDKEKDDAGEVHEYSAHDRKNEYDEETAKVDEKEVDRRRDEEIAHYNDKIARQKDDEAARIQRDAEHLRLAERVLRNEVGRLRKEALISKMNQRHGQEQGAKIHYIHNLKNHKTMAKTETKISKPSKHLKTETVGTIETRIPKRSKQTIESVDTTEDSYSDESHNSDNPHKGPKKINDENATENLKKLLQDTATDYSDTQNTHSDSSVISANFRDKTRQGINIPETDSSTSSSESSENIIKINNYTTPKFAKELINKTLQDMVKKTKLQGKNKKGDPSTTTKVTTVRTGEIFTDSHEVTEEKDILEFTIHLYSETLKIFGRIKDKTDQDHVKHKIESLMRSYQDKFKEFVKDRDGQKIKTRLGAQKVILNTIDTSNLLLRRLMNFLLSDLDKKGLLRQNTGTANRFQKAIDVELKQQSLHACTKFGICRSEAGFSSFLADVLEILLKTDDIKFKQSIDAFTEAIKYMKFPHMFEPETLRKLKIVIIKTETLDVEVLRAVVKLLRNTMKSQNKPVIVSHYSARRNIVNSTLAFLEIIDLLDLLIPPNKDNSLEWDDVKVSLRGFADGQRTDIQEIIEKSLRNFRKKVRSFDKNSKAIISKNLGIILSYIIDTFG